jgi:hypothetical protein
MYHPKHLSRVRANEGLTTRRPKHRRKARRSPLLVARAVSTAVLSVGPVFGVAAYYDVPVESPPILLTSGDGEGGGTSTRDSATTHTTGGTTTGGADTGGTRVSDGIRDVIDRVIDSVRPGSGANGSTGTNRPPGSTLGNGRSGEVENPSGTETGEKAGTAVVTDSPLPRSASAHHWRSITQNAGQRNSEPTRDVAAEPQSASETGNAADTTWTRVGESAQPGATTQPVIGQAALSALAASPTPATILTGLLATFGLSPTATKDPLVPVDPFTTVNNPLVAGLVAPVLDPPLGEQDPPDQRLNTGDPLFGLGGVNQSVGNLVRPGLPGLIDFIAFGGSFVRDELAVFTGSPPPGCSANPTCERRLEVGQDMQTPPLPVIDTIDQALIVLDWYGDAFGETTFRSLIENLSGASLGDGPLADAVDLLDLLLVDVDYFTGVPLRYTPVRSVIFEPLTVLELAVNASPVFLNLVAQQ